MPVPPTATPQTSGLQSELTDKVRAVATNFSDEKSLLTIGEICYWIRDNLECVKTKEPIFRHVEELLGTRQLFGCHDYGLLFAALARAKGFTVNYIQAFDVELIRSYQQNPEDIGSTIRGHVFCEVLVNDSWVLIDPRVPCYYKGYKRNNKYLPGSPGPRGSYLLYRKGLDSWDIGIKDRSDMVRAIRELVETADLSDYSEPDYEVVVFQRR